MFVDVGPVKERVTSSGLSVPEMDLMNHISPMTVNV